MRALGSWKHDDIAKQQVFVKSLFVDDIILQLIFLGDDVPVTAFLLYNICILHYTFCTKYSAFEKFEITGKVVRKNYLATEICY